MEAAAYPTPIPSLFAWLHIGRVREKGVFVSPWPIGSELMELGSQLSALVPRASQQVCHSICIEIGGLFELSLACPPATPLSCRLGTVLCAPRECWARNRPTPGGSAQRRGRARQGMRGGWHGVHAARWLRLWSSPMLFHVFPPRPLHVSWCAIVSGSHLLAR